MSENRRGDFFLTHIVHFISVTSCDMVNFVFKFINFHYLVNRSRSSRR